MDPRSRFLVDTLHLAPHPEGGFFREVFRSPSTLPELPRGPRVAMTAIYYLLPEGTFSALHRVTSDEIWHHYEGAPVELHLIREAGPHDVVHLGRAIERDERLQYPVPAGIWQAARPIGGYALCGCTVAPGFDFADFEMPPRAALLARLPDHADAVRQLSRE